MIASVRAGLAAALVVGSLGRTAVKWNGYSDVRLGTAFCRRWWRRWTQMRRLALTLITPATQRPSRYFK